MDSIQNTSSTAAAGATTANGVEMISNLAAANEQQQQDESSSKQKKSLDRVIDSIDKTLGILHQLHLTVSSFNVASQLPLLQRLNALVAELDNMQKVSENCNIQVPMEVVSLIDDGKNPDEFNRDVLNSCIAKNQITKGKTDAFKGLRRLLLEELEQSFPDEVEAYREIRATSAAESKRLAQAQSTLPNGDVENEQVEDREPDYILKMQDHSLLYFKMSFKHLANKTSWVQS